MTMLDSPDRFVHFIDWLAAHPSLALDLGPWILITASILSLVGIHAPSFRRICAKLRQPADKKENIGRAVPSSQTAINLPIGSLRYVIATMNLEIKEDLSRVSGRIEVELHNDSDFLDYVSRYNRWQNKWSSF
jgi:hypothetical protein